MVGMWEIERKILGGQFHITSVYVISLALSPTTPEQLDSNSFSDRN